MIGNLRRLAVAVLAPILAYLIAAGAGGLIPGPTAAFDTGHNDQTIGVGLIFGPIHVDFLLPADDQTRAALQFAEAAGVPVSDPQAAYILAGWGAREFYTATGSYADLQASAVLRAVTGDASVLRLDVVGRLPEDFNYPRLQLSPEQYAALLEGIARTAEGRPIDAAGLSATDGFVEAVGRFHIFRTCNTWVSRQLRAVGVPMGIWTPTPYAVRLSVWRIRT